MPRAAQERDHVAAAQDPRRARDRPQDLALAIIERRILDLEGAVLLVEAHVLEPAVEGALGEPHQAAVHRSRLAALHRVEEAGLGEIVRGIHRVDAAGDVAGEVIGLHPAIDQREQAAERELAQVERGHADARPLVAGAVGDEAPEDLGEQGDVLVDLGERRRLETTLDLEAREHALQITRHPEHEPRDQHLRVAAIRARREQTGLAQQIVELQVELSRVVPVGPEREGFGKYAREARAGVALEAHFARVERIREPERELKPLDAQLQTFDSAGRLQGFAQRTRCLEFSPDS